MLLSRGTESTFQIVETNDFKQLAHISLAFKPGCNATVKNVCCTAAVVTTHADVCLHGNHEPGSPAAWGHSLHTVVFAGHYPAHCCRCLCACSF